jgi:hypothetical protein
MLASALAGMVIPALPRARAQGQASASASAAAAEPVLVVDLRAAGAAEREATRRELEAALVRDTRLRLLSVEPGLAAVLRGPAEVAERAALAPLQAEIERAAALRQDGDCQRALEAADAAIVGLAAEQAASAADPAAALVVQGLTAAHGHALACAHQLGDTGRALATAQWLRALGHGDATPPPGIGAELWRAYPALDALGNAAIVELAITTEPPGAQVWLDHVLAGVSPVSVLAGEGAHLVAAAGADGAVSQRVQVSQAALPRVAWGQSQVMAVHLSLGPRPWAWHAEAAAVARWRSAGAVDGQALAALLARLDARFAVVLVDADARLVRSGAPGTPAAQIWAVEPGAGEARRVGTGQLARPEAIATRIVTRAAAWGGVTDGSSGRAEPGVPLLREGDVPSRFGSRPGGRRLARQPWWAYATIIGAVAATSLLILAADLGDDRQRIELRWP